MSPSSPCSEFTLTLSPLMVLGQHMSAWSTGLSLSRLIDSLCFWLMRLPCLPQGLFGLLLREHFAVHSARSYLLSKFRHDLVRDVCMMFLTELEFLIEKRPPTMDLLPGQAFIALKAIEQSCKHEESFAIDPWCVQSTLPTKGMRSIISTVSISLEDFLPSILLLMVIIVAVVIVTVIWVVVVDVIV
ncbi:hypothetical protein Tco_0309530 [Tanacetum coccineum]